jgi:Spy/CpxP family protein refolding chaperone
MNNAIRNKFLTWLVVTLLVANAGTILFFWINRPERMQGAKGSPREFLIHALELDSSQLDAFQDLIEAHQASARPLKKEIRSAKENLFQLLKQPVIPETEKMKAVQVITDKTKALELLNLEHFQQLRALCNDKQKKKFDGLLDQLAGLMTAPPNADGHRPPPPGEGHPPPPGEGHPPHGGKRPLPPPDQQ